MRTYWSCSKFAHKILPKPHSATAEEWNKWRRESKKNTPFRYFLVEEVFDHAQKFICSPVTFARWVWLQAECAFAWKYQGLHSPSLKFNRYADMDRLFLYANFDSFRDHVEIALASKDENFKPKVKWNLFSKNYYRDPAAGVAYLKWYASLTDEGVSAEHAQKALDLYNWWVNYKPDVSPYEEELELERKKAREQDPDEDSVFSLFNGKASPRYRELIRLVGEWETEQYEIETKKLQELMGIRGFLW